MNIRRILFPVDFSDGSHAVTTFVHSIAQRHHAEVVLLHVIQPPMPLYGGSTAGDGITSIYPDTFDYEAVRGTTLRNLEEFAARELPRLPVTSVVDVGDPATLIAEFARENATDLICLATRGHGAFRRALLGSVAAKVLHDASVPVWMDAHAPEPSHRAHPQPRHILAAIEPGDCARETLDASVAIAKETDATLEIVTAVAEGMFAPGLVDAQLDELLKDGTREQLAKLQFEAGTQAGMIIEIGSPAKVIRDAALAKRADLVVCGRGVGNGLLDRLQNDSYAIIREAPCPVISL